MSAPAVTGPAGTVASARALVLVLEHAERLGLPIPHTVEVCRFDQLDMRVDTVAEVAEWAKALDAQVSELGPYGGTSWVTYEVLGQILEQPVSIAVSVDTSKAAQQ